MHWNVPPDALPGSATFALFRTVWRNNCLQSTITAHLLPYYACAALGSHYGRQLVIVGNPEVIGSDFGLCLTVTLQAKELLKKWQTSHTW